MDSTVGVSVRNSSVQLLQLSTTETDGHIFLNLTNITTDKFGHLELSGPAHVRLEAAASGGILQPAEIFLQLESTLFELNENLWKVVLPKPAKSIYRDRLFDSPAPNPLQSPPTRSVGGVDPSLRDYGRNDLDPLGVDDWTRQIGGTGGMVIDPTQALRQPRSSFGLPRPSSTVPPGARFDPIGPPMMPPDGIGPRGSRFNNPDPDSALPPGWEDMYM
ncbi:Proteasome inhibitor PI31 subunit [Taenia crassiceps]|uniref:Proteasome inhibitor PI31 subunit n=1 Tax=Taenia crassiceps TaxID=6207 RepID=A0ABR4QK47_9CEST